MKTELLKKILNILKYSIVCLFLVSVLIVGICFSGIGKGLFGGDFYRVITPSMEPEFSVGDYIIVESVNIRDIRVNDIVVYISEDEEIAGKPVAHRVLDIEEKDGEMLFTVKGDAEMQESKRQIEGKSIISKVVKKSAFLTVIGKMLMTPKSLILFFALPALIIGIIQIVYIVKTVEQDKNVKQKITDAGFDPNDKKLCELVEKYGISILDSLKK